MNDMKIARSTVFFYCKLIHNVLYLSTYIGYLRLNTCVLNNRKVTLRVILFLKN